MRIAGYAAIFDAPDRGGDVVRKGAFGRVAAAGLPLLWQHDGARRIGTVESLAEDGRGLRMVARVDDAAVPVRAGSGLSFGYRVRAMQRGAYRELTDLDLIEVSIVTHPMQPLARVLAVAAIELPLLGLSDPGKPVVALFASGTDAGWRRAALSLNGAGGKVDIGVTAQPAIMGSTLEPLTPHPTHVLDERGGFTVQMLNSGMDMANRTGSPIDPDAPLIWLAGEFIRLGNCEDLGGGIYRFSRLLRGCYGFDEPVATHPTGAAFVLIEPESARLVEERTFNSGDRVEAEAFGLGDTHPATASAHIRALATTPPAPIHGELRWTAEGGVAAQWIRRSRVDNGWNDGVDQIMAEESERFRLRLFADDAPFGEWEMSVPSFLLSAEEVPFSGATTRPILTAEVVQIGRFAASKPLRLGPC